MTTEPKDPVPLPSAGQDGPPKSSHARHGHAGTEKQPIPDVENIIAVASGKGGVGKSTVAVNLALALAKRGFQVGLCDTDIYGPSLPLMMGVKRRPEISPEQKIKPLEQYGIKLMSIGFLVDDDTAIIWRGPMVTQMIRQFLRDVTWGKLDFLILDLPPGTGDAQLTIIQTIPLTGGLIVTTPNDIALLDARRGLQMFREVSVPVIGIVDNMASFECPHCHETTYIFDRGGGERTAKELQVPYLGEIPLDPKIRKGGDSGQPVVVSNPEDSQSKAFFRIADAVLERTGKGKSKKGILGSLLSRL